MSCSGTDDPEVVSAADALQMLPLTDQVCVPAAQLASCVLQETAVGEVLHTPLLHE
jgi:hypothetical protein